MDKDGHGDDFKLSPKSKFFYQREKSENKLTELNNETDYSLQIEQDYSEEYSNIAASQSASSSNQSNSTLASENSSSLSQNSLSNDTVVDIETVEGQQPLTVSENETNTTRNNHIETVHPRPESKPEQYVIYKSMNFLPFTTRFEMLKKGTSMKLVDANPRQAVQIIDNKPPEFSKKKCQVLKYVSMPSDSSSSDESEVEPPKENDTKKVFFSSLNIKRNLRKDLLKAESNINSLTKEDNSGHKHFYRFRISRNGNNFQFDKQEKSEKPISPPSGGPYKKLRYENGKFIELENDEEPTTSNCNDNIEGHDSKCGPNMIHMDQNIKDDMEIKERETSEAAEILLSMANSCPVVNNSPQQSKPDFQRNNLKVISTKDIAGGLVKIIANPIRLNSASGISIIRNANGLVGKSILINRQALPRYNIQLNKEQNKIDVIKNQTEDTKILNKNTVNDKNQKSLVPAYITLVKPDKKQMLMLKNQNFLNPNKKNGKESDSVKDPDFEAFASSWHEMNTDVAGNPIHKCTLCSKVFTVYDAYYSHVRVHYKVHNKCSVCGKIFTRSWLLKGHMRTHTGERPYACDYPDCNKAFADRSNLRSHMLIHQNKGKQYTCTVCNRSFAQKRYMHKHMAEVCRAAEATGSPLCSSTDGNYSSMEENSTNLEFCTND